MTSSDFIIRGAFIIYTCGAFVIIRGAFVIILRVLNIIRIMHCFRRTVNILFRHPSNSGLYHKIYA